MICVVDDGLYIHLLQQLSIQFVILLAVGFIREYPRLHGPIRQHIVNGFVDNGRCVPTHKCAKRKIVVPRDHRELTIFLVEIIIVNHTSGIAVIIDYIIMDYEVTQDIIHIYHFV